jgi:hypothetical protein
MVGSSAKARFSIARMAPLWEYPNNTTLVSAIGNWALTAAS